MEGRRKKDVVEGKRVGWSEGWGGGKEGGRVGWREGGGRLQCYFYGVVVMWIT